MAKTNAELLKEVAELKEETQKFVDEISAFIEEREKLKEENERLQKLIDDSIEFIESDDDTLDGVTREEVIKSLLPQVRLQHARPDAQNLLRAADEILKEING